MRLQINHPVIFIQDRLFPYILYILEKLEFFWCMPPVIHLTNYGIVAREKAIAEKISFKSQNRQDLRTRLRHLSHVHYTQECCSVVATFPDDRNYWFYKRFWFVDRAFQSNHIVMPVCITWRIMEMFHVSEFFPPPKYIILPPDIIKHVLSFIQYSEKFLICSLVSKQFNTLNQRDVIIIDG